MLITEYLRWRWIFPFIHFPKYSWVKIFRRFSVQTFLFISNIWICRFVIIIVSFNISFLPGLWNRNRKFILCFLLMTGFPSTSKILSFSFTPYVLIVLSPWFGWKIRFKEYHSEKCCLTSHSWHILITTLANLCCSCNTSSITVTFHRSLFSGIHFNNVVAYRLISGMSKNLYSFRAF